MLDPFSLPFVQQGLWAVLLLSVGAGVLGTYVVLRGLAFYAHGVAAATFPGLVLADGLGFAAPLGALGVALLFAASVGGLASGRRASEHGTATAMVLVGALAVGVVLASDVFDAATAVNGLLFGSLLLISDGDLAIAGGVSAAVLVAAALLGSRWVAVGFDPEGARSVGIGGRVADRVLLLLVALVAVACLSAVGSLLAAALMVIPAATVRPWISRMPAWQVATVLLTALVGTAGLWVSVRTDAPPGATIAVLSGVLFMLSTTAHALRGRRRLLPRAAVVTAALAALGVAGCGSDDDADSASGSGGGARVTVLATTTQLGDLVRQVGGDAVDVHQLLQANTDPHEYEPRPSDVTETAKAKVVLASGLGLDAWVGDLVKQAGNDPTVVTVGAKVPVQRASDEEEGEEHEHEHAEDEAGHEDEHADEEEGHHHDHGPIDPHWWHDPRNAAAAVPVIRDALIAAAPDRRAEIERSASAYEAKLKALDRGIAACIDRVPAAQRKLVTSHDAFGYFTDRYGIEVVGAVIPSITTNAQPSAADVSKLAAQVRKEKVKAIFPESSVNPKLAEALARQTGAVANLTLYGDSLGPQGSDGATYLGMERHNAETMVRGFTGGAVRCSFPGL